MARKPYASPVPHEVPAKRCFHCDSQLARIPATRPRFCGIDCMLIFAEWATAGQVWCQRHGCWYEVDDLCSECEAEKHQEARP